MVASQQITMNDRLAYTVPEAVTLAGLGRTVVYAAIKDGSLKVRKLGKRTLIRREDLIAFVDGLPLGGPE